MCSVYILYSINNNRYYIGISADVTKRLLEHNKGKTRSTRAFRPWVLVYKEDFETRTEARNREVQIKSYKGGVAFKKLIRVGT